MEHSCTHEQDWGQVKTDIKTSFYRIDSLQTLCEQLDQKIDLIKEERVITTRLTLNLERLADEMEKANHEFKRVITNHDERLYALENAEGERLKKYKQATVNAFIAAAGSMLAGYLLGVFL